MKKTIKMKKLNIKYLVIVGLLILGGFFLFNSLTQTARIARIDTAESGSCKSNLESFEAANLCSSTGFSNYTYSCKNMPSVQMIKASECMSYETAYNKVSAECGQICNVVVNSPVPTIRPSMTPTPTPIPTSTATPIPSPTPVVSCAKQLGSWTYREACSKNPLSFHYLDFKCSGSDTTFTIGSGSTCKTDKALVAEAKNTCLNTACLTPTPSPRPTVKPTPIPVKKCYKVFGRSYCWTQRR